MTVNVLSNGQRPNQAFKRPILQEQFIKGFIKLVNQMCELNYRGTKIEIGVKLRDQKCNFSYKK